MKINSSSLKEILDEVDNAFSSDGYLKTVLEKSGFSGKEIDIIKKGIDFTKTPGIKASFPRVSSISNAKSSMPTWSKLSIGAGVGGLGLVGLMKYLNDKGD